MPNLSFHLFGKFGAQDNAQPMKGLDGKDSRIIPSAS